MESDGHPFLGILYILYIIYYLFIIYIIILYIGFLDGYWMDTLFGVTPLRPLSSLSEYLSGKEGKVPPSHPSLPLSSVLGFQWVFEVGHRLN